MLILLQKYVAKEMLQVSLGYSWKRKLGGCVVRTTMKISWLDALFVTL